jgi:hypothetical protein
VLGTVKNGVENCLYAVSSGCDIWCVMLQEERRIKLGRDSSVGIATRCRLDGPDPGGGEIFRTRPDRPWGQPSLLYNG